MHRWLILCNDCSEGLDPESIVGIFEAKYGPQEGDPEMSVLVCCSWRERDEDVWSNQFFCDECGQPVAVAASSQWFIDFHRSERDEQIERA